MLFRKQITTKKI